MFEIIKKAFFTGLALLSSVNPLITNQFSMTNQECKVRLETVNVNNSELVFYPFSIKTSKCGGSCNNINDPYAKMCVPDVIKKINVKVFNLQLMKQDV